MAEDALSIAIRAEEAARSAHHRLDRMNGSIDRLTAEVAKANATGTEILRRLDHEQGFQEGSRDISRGLLDSRRFVVSMIVLLLTSSITTLLLTWALKGH